VPVGAQDLQGRVPERLAERGLRRGVIRAHRPRAHRNPIGAPSVGRGPGGGREAGRHGLSRNAGRAF
jgi:hypothetical protein